MAAPPTDSDRKFLQNELAMVSEDKGSPARLNWLADHLEEYVERWLGFCAVLTKPKSVTTAAGFSTVELGAGAITDELKHATPSPELQSSWRAFLESLELVRSRGGHAEADKLFEAARMFRSSINEDYSAQ